MIGTKIIAVALAAASVIAAPVELAKRAAPGQADIDTVILNYALTLEHLEDAFYQQVPSAEAFQQAGFPSWIRNRFVEIGGHEKTHVDFLTKALGKDAVAACTYNFGDISKPAAFIATSLLLEGVGVSAYLGAAANITNSAYLTAAASILTTEARHSAWVQSAAGHESPAASAFDTPTNFNQTYSLAAPLITSCPEGNAALPVVAFPALTLSPASPKVGEEVTVTAEGLADGQKLAFITGAGMTAVVAVQGGKAKLPELVQGGRTYAVLLKEGQEEISDANTVAGPASFDIFMTAEAAAAAATEARQKSQ